MKAKRRPYLFLILLLVALLGLYGFGSNLPATHEITVKALYHQPREALFNAISNYEKTPEWSSSVARVERLPDHNGLPVWRFYDKDGHQMEIEVVASQAPSRHVSRLMVSDFPFTGTWTFELQETAGKTMVTLTEEGRVNSPIWRLIQRYGTGQDAMLRNFLLELGTKFSETPQILGPSD